MKKITLSVTEDVYEDAVKLSKHGGLNTDSNNGVTLLVRQALKEKINRERKKITEP